MRAFVLILVLLSGIPAMAKKASDPDERARMLGEMMQPDMRLSPPPREPTPDEIWERLPERADIRRFEAMVARGEITRDEAVRQYRKKWGIAVEEPRQPVRENPAFMPRW